MIRQANHGCVWYKLDARFVLVRARDFLALWCLNPMCLRCAWERDQAEVELTGWVVTAPAPCKPARSAGEHSSRLAPKFRNQSVQCMTVLTFNAMGCQGGTAHIPSSGDASRAPTTAPNAQLHAQCHLGASGCMRRGARGQHRGVRQAQCTASPDGAFHRCSLAERRGGR